MPRVRPSGWIDAEATRGRGGQVCSFAAWAKGAVPRRVVKMRGLVMGQVVIPG